MQKLRAIWVADIYVNEKTMHSIVRFIPLTRTYICKKHKTRTGKTPTLRGWSLPKRMAVKKVVELQHFLLSSCVCFLN